MEFSQVVFGPMNGTLREEDTLIITQIFLRLYERNLLEIYPGTEPA